MASVVEGLESSIDYFLFRQCPAEFKLKATASAKSDSSLKAEEIPSWTSAVTPKTSLIHISHDKGVVIFPHYEKGALAFAPLLNLAEADKIDFESLQFPGDESFILAMALDPKERLLFIAKGSNKLYSVDLAKESAEKRPFVAKITQLESTVVQCVATESFGLFVLLENGNVLNFDSSLQPFKAIDFALIKESIGCISKVENNILVLGCKNKSELIILFLSEEEEASIENVVVPHEDLGCGSVGISSLFLESSGNSLLFSCVPENPDSDDVPLLGLENIANSGEILFSHYLDPCAARPPRANQFYFVNLPVSEWAQNLSDLVVLGNFGSPDLGVCGRVENDGPIDTFYIDNDEGLAQLPFVNNDTAYPVGLALDLSSKMPIKNTVDPDAPDYPPAPIVWILTNTAQLCPFALLKTDENQPHSFMRRDVPAYKVNPESTLEVKEAPIIKPATPVAPSTPQTPSKVPLEKLTSLQKSTEIKPEPVIVEKSAATSAPFSLKPVLEKPVDTVKEKPQLEKVVKEEQLPEVKEISIVKAAEKFESINVGPYQNILLTEIASTHAAMQEDIFVLRQLSLKNSLLLRQNSQKYFNSLSDLEKYAETLEKLVASSGKVFEDLKGRVEGLKGGLMELVVKEKQVKSTWNRVKQDKQIDWDSKIKVLNRCSEDLFDKLNRVHIFISNPSEASKYRATLESFVDSAQEQIQILMAHIGNIFCCDTETAVLPKFASLNLSPSLSSESLMDQMNVLSLNSVEGSSQNSEEKRKNLYESILKSAKTRGARLLVPRKISPSLSKPAAPIKLSAEDESLISSLISSIKLTEQVPEFAETAQMSKLSINTGNAEKPSIDDKSKASEVKSFKFKAPVSESTPFEFKPAESVKPFEFKPVKPTEPIKPFEFKLTTEVKPEISKLIEKTEITKAETPKPFEFKSISETKSESVKPFEFKPISETKSDIAKPFEFKSINETKSGIVKPFEFKVKSEKEDLNPEIEIKKDETPKIPSIFTAKLTDEKSNSSNSAAFALPSLDSISLGGTKLPEESGGDQKPKVFPGIFGVPAEKKKEETTSSAAPSAATTTTTTSSITTSSANAGFSFSFKSDPVKSEMTEDKPKFSFGATGNNFSITSKPQFPSSNAPVFGATSLPSAPISSLTPAFGQLPSGFSSFDAAKPAASNSSGFAAFAAASSSSGPNNIGFSAFSAPNPNPSGSGLTFASFLPNKSDQDAKDDSKKPNSSFSFTGFRE